jgi:hypothetical protein
MHLSGCVCNGLGRATLQQVSHAAPQAFATLRFPVMLNVISWLHASAQRLGALLPGAPLTSEYIFMSADLSPLSLAWVRAGTEWMMGGVLQRILSANCR